VENPGAGYRDADLHFLFADLHSLFFEKKNLFFAKQLSLLSG